MSNHYDRHLNKRAAAIVRLRDIYSAAILCGYSGDDLQRDVSRVRATLNKCPEWARAYFDGYESALRAGLYENHLIHGGWYGGKFYSTLSSRADYYGKHGIAAEHWPTANNTGHYWKPESHGGEARPFFTARVR